VTTADFQEAMERAGGRSLSDFFAKWVYLTRR
jgi:aminopeptidase N